MNSDIFSLKGLDIPSNDKIKSNKGIPDFDWTKVPPAPSMPNNPNVWDSIVNLETQLKYVFEMSMDGKDCKKKDMRMGNAYYIDTAIKCDNDSDHVCKGKPMSIQLNHYEKKKGCSQKCNSGNGIVPSLVNDITILDPMSIVMNLVGKGNIINTSCKQSAVQIKHKYPYENEIVYEQKTTCVPKDIDCDTFKNVNTNST